MVSMHTCIHQVFVDKLTLVGKSDYCELGRQALAALHLLQRLQAGFPSREVLLQPVDFAATHAEAQLAEMHVSDLARSRYSLIDSPC